MTAFLNTCKRIILVILIITCTAYENYAQTKQDTSGDGRPAASVDDPSQFFTRIEIFNELMHFNKGYNLNFTTWRTNVKIGKKLTTRVDIPWVYNSSNSPENYKGSGLGDISFRLLGYKILESPKAAVTVSLEFSLNTAASPLLGTGKNLIIPLITYSKLFHDRKTVLAFAFQQANSISGDENRKPVNFSKLQMVLIKAHSPKFWTIIITDWYADYQNGGVSLNAKLRAGYRVTPIVQFWTQGAVGVFGDFVGRYQWSVEMGTRFFFLRKPK